MYSLLEGYYKLDNMEKCYDCIDQLCNIDVKFQIFELTE